MASPHAYDPIGPLRNPLSKRTLEAATRDMARVIELYAASRDDVVEEDLVRAGFTPAEIDRCWPGAMALVAGRTPGGAHADVVLEMAAFMALAATGGMDGTVTRADLHRGGFTDAEIDACQAEAVAATRRQLAPRRITLSAA